MANLISNVVSTLQSGSSVPSTSSIMNTSEIAAATTAFQTELSSDSLGSIVDRVASSSGAIKDGISGAVGSLDTSALTEGGLGSIGDPTKLLSGAFDDAANAIESMCAAGGLDVSSLSKTATGIDVSALASKASSASSSGGFSLSSLVESASTGFSDFADKVSSSASGLGDSLSSGLSGLSSAVSGATAGLGGESGELSLESATDALGSSLESVAGSFAPSTSSVKSLPGTIGAAVAGGVENLSAWADGTLKSFDSQLDGLMDQGAALAEKAMSIADTARDFFESSLTDSSESLKSFEADINDFVESVDMSGPTKLADAITGDSSGAIESVGAYAKNIAAQVSATTGQVLDSLKGAVPDSCGSSGGGVLDTATVASTVAATSGVTGSSMTSSVTNKAPTAGSAPSDTPSTDFVPMTRDNVTYPLPEGVFVLPTGAVIDRRRPPDLPDGVYQLPSGKIIDTRTT